MAKVTPITEQFQHFVRDLKETFWGDLYGKTRRDWERFWEEESRRERDRYLVTESYERAGEKRRGYRNGYYVRDFVTRLGTLRVRVARSRERSFRPPGLERFQRRAPEVLMLIREAFLRGISTRQVGRVVGIVTGEVVSAQTVSKVTRSLDRLVKAFQQARLKDEWAYLFLDGVSLRVRRPAGRQRVQMLVAYGVRADGSRQLLGFLRSRGESQAAWEGLLEDLYRRGLEGRNLKLIITDGCEGLAAALADRLSAGAASTLLGAQDAEYSGARPQARLRPGEGRRPGDLSRRGPPGGAGRFPGLSLPLERDLSGHGQAPGARLAGAAVVLQLSPAALAQVAHHERDRALLRRGAASHPAHGLLRQRLERRPDYLCHL